MKRSAFLAASAVAAIPVAAVAAPKPKWRWYAVCRDYGQRCSQNGIEKIIHPKTENAIVERPLLLCEECLNQLESLPRRA
jgi:hypothetical protein